MGCNKKFPSFVCYPLCVIFTPWESAWRAYTRSWWNGEYFIFATEYIMYIRRALARTRSHPLAHSPAAVRTSVNWFMERHTEINQILLYVILLSCYFSLSFCYRYTNFFIWRLRAPSRSLAHWAPSIFHEFIFRVCPPFVMYASGSCSLATGWRNDCLKRSQRWPIFIICKMNAKRCSPEFGWRELCNMMKATTHRYQQWAARHRARKMSNISLFM